MPEQAITIKHPQRGHTVPSNFVAQGRYRGDRQVHALVLNLETGAMSLGIRRLRPGFWSFTFLGVPMGAYILLVADSEGEADWVHFQVANEYAGPTINHPAEGGTVDDTFTSYGTAAANVNTVSGTVSDGSNGITSMQPANNEGFWTIEFGGVSAGARVLTVTDDQSQETPRNINVQ